MTLADVLSGELSEELVQNLLVLLLGDLEALVPSTLLCQQLQSRQVTTFNDLGDLVARDVRLLLALLDLLDEHLLHLHGAHLLSTIHGSVPLFDLEVGVDGIVVPQDGLKDFSCRLKLLDVEQSGSEDINHVVKLILSEVHGQVEGVIPDLFQLVLVGEVLLRDFQVAVDSLSVLALFLPNLATVEDFLAGL